MLHPFKILLAAVAVGGLATVPTVSQAESSKSGSMSDSKKSQAKSDDFEENRKAHMQKSKENNASKGAN